MGQSTDMTKDRPRQARHGETWQEHWQRRMRQTYPGDIPMRRSVASRGDQAKPAQPEGTTSLDREHPPIDTSR
jgi:hypothetical protein